MEKRFIDVKKIVGNKYKAGIYAYSDDSAVQLLDINNRVLVNLNLSDKLEIFDIEVNKMINNGLSDEILSVEKIFDVVMDAKSRDLEKSVNELFHKVVFLYSKPNIDIKEILSIVDLISNRINNNEYVKEEICAKTYYI